MTTLEVEPLITHRLQMASADLGWLAKGMLAAAASTEGFGPIFHGLIRVDGTSLDGFGTDRHRIHHLHVDLASECATFEVMIPRDALTWASKNVTVFKSKKDSLIEPVGIIEIDLFTAEPPLEGRVTMIYLEWDDPTAPSARFDAPLRGETYPPVARIIDAHRIAPEGEPAPLPLEHIADARALMTPFGTTPTIRFTTNGDGKPGAAVLDFWESSRFRGTAIITPVSDGSEAAS